MLDCKEVSRITASDGALAANRWQRVGARLHLMMCRHCREYADQIRSVGAASRKMIEGLVPDSKRLAELEDSITRRIMENGSGEGGEETED